MRNPRLSQRILAFITIGIYAFVSPQFLAVAAPEPRIDLRAGGIDRDEGETTGRLDLFVPLVGNERGLFYLSPRSSGETTRDGVYSGSLLIGGRSLIGSSIVAGAYIGGDLTDYSANRYSQFGAGLELFSEYFDLRFNYYLPEIEKNLLDEQIFEEEFTQTSVSNRAFERHVGLLPSHHRVIERKIAGVTRTTTTRTEKVREVYRHYEQPMEGYDVEATLKLPLALTQPSVFVGWSEYNPDFATLNETEGARAGMRWKLLEGLEVQVAYDEYAGRGSLGAEAWSGDVTVSIPWGANWKNAFQPYRRNQNLTVDRLLGQRVERRDIEVAISEMQLAQRSRSVHVDTDTQTFARQFDFVHEEDIIFVDNAGAIQNGEGTGAGQGGNPFADLQMGIDAAIAKSEQQQKKWKVFVFGDHEGSYDIQSAHDVDLLSAHVRHYDLHYTKGSAQLTKNQSKITGGFGLTSSQRVGIYGFEGTQGYGENPLEQHFIFSQDTRQLVVDGNTIHDVVRNGVYHDVRSGQSSLHATNNIFSHLGKDGLTALAADFEDDDQGVSLTVDIHHNHIHSLTPNKTGGGNGISLIAQNSEDFQTDATLTGSVTQNKIDETNCGIQVTGWEGSTIGSDANKFLIAGNTITQSSMAGMRFHLDNHSALSIAVSGNTIDQIASFNDTPGSGVKIYAGLKSQFRGVFSDNQILDDDQSSFAGIDAESIGSHFELEMTRNLLSGHGGRGAQFSFKNSTGKIDIHGYNHFDENAHGGVVLNLTDQSHLTALNITEKNSFSSNGSTKDDLLSGTGFTLHVEDSTVDSIAITGSNRFNFNGQGEIGEGFFADFSGHSELGLLHIADFNEFLGTIGNLNHGRGSGVRLDASGHANLGQVTIANQNQFSENSCDGIMLHLWSQSPDEMVLLSNLNIQGNLFSQNGFAGLNMGVSSRGSDGDDHALTWINQITLRDNLFQENGSHGATLAAYSHEGATTQMATGGLIIENNHFAHNYQQGITFWTEARDQSLTEWGDWNIAHNTIEKNGRGIYFQAKSVGGSQISFEGNNLLVNNVIERNGFEGIKMDLHLHGGSPQLTQIDMGDWTFQENTIARNGSHGIDLSSAINLESGTLLDIGALRFVSNAIEYNGVPAKSISHGVLLDLSTTGENQSVLVDQIHFDADGPQNIISHNTGYGLALLLHNGSDKANSSILVHQADIAHSIFSRNALSGIIVDTHLSHQSNQAEVGTFSFVGNTVNYNQQRGLFLKTSGGSIGAQAESTISENMIIYNGSQGLSLYAGVEGGAIDIAKFSQNSLGHNISNQLSVFAGGANSSVSIDGFSANNLFDTDAGTAFYVYNNNGGNVWIHDESKGNNSIQNFGGGKTIDLIPDQINSIFGNITVNNAFYSFSQGKDLP